MGARMKLRKGPEHAVEASEPPRQAQPAQGAASAAHGQGRTLLGELLVSSQVLTHDQLAEALIQQSTAGGRIGATLVELGAISERDLAEALSTQLLVPIVDLSQQTPTPEAVDALSESVARAHLAVPIAIDPQGITIAVADPNPELAKTLANSSGRVVRLVIAPKSDVQRAINTAYRALGNIQEHVRAFEDTDAPRRAQ